MYKFTIYANGQNIAEDCGTEYIFTSRTEAEREARHLRHICPKTDFEVRTISPSEVRNIAENLLAPCGY